MEKVYGLIEILKLLAYILKDSDGDGRADLFDSDPDNPEIK